MTDRTQPEAVADCIFRLRGLRHVDRHEVAHAMESMVARIADLEAQLEAVGAGGVSGPLMARASLSANAGKPVAWQYRSLRDNGAWFDCTKERFEMRCTQPEIWETRALYAAPPTSAEGVEHGPVAHDEELLEQMYWEFDGQRRRTGEERLAFKGKMRSYASEFRRRSEGKMTFAQSVSDDMMNLADRLGSEYDDVDPRAWKHLLVYAPKTAPEVREQAAQRLRELAGVPQNDVTDLFHPLYTSPQPAPDCHHRPPCDECAAYDAQGGK